MPSPLDVIPESSNYESIVLGKEFKFPADTIEGAPEGQELLVTPEVTNILDDNGKILTVKVIYKLSPPIVHPYTNETVDRIAMGSFGQDDLVRIYMTSIYTADIASIKEYIEVKLHQAKMLYGEGAKIRADEFFYTCLNATFFANPNSSYEQGNIHHEVRWTDIPKEVLTEIEKRIRNNEPVNYMYLAHLLEEQTVMSLNLSDLAPIIRTRAAEQFERSALHKIDLVTGKFSLDTNNIYDFLATSLVFWDFEVEFEGNIVFTNAEIRDFFLDFDLMSEIMSDKPAINFASLVINSIIDRVNNNFYGNSLPYSLERLPLVCDRIREVITRRLYKQLQVFDEQGVHKDKLVDMTLGEFASQVYELRLNNSDSNLRNYRKRHDDSAFRVRKAMLARNES